MINHLHTNLLTQEVQAILTNPIQGAIVQNLRTPMVTVQDTMLVLNGLKIMTLGTVTGIQARLTKAVKIIYRSRKNMIVA